MADTDPSLYNLRYNQASSNLEAFGGGTPQWTLVSLNNVDPKQVPITRLINTTAPLMGGGNLSADRTLFIPAATNLVDGYLLHSDWNTFNAKLSSSLANNEIFVGNGSNIAAGVSLSGDATIVNTGLLTLTSVNSNVGSFTNAAITVDIKGRITAASSGVVGNLTDAGTDGITITNGIGAVLGSGASIAQHVADTTHNGYLSSSDWNRFNSDTAGITALTGDVTATGPGSVPATLATVNSNVGSFTLADITVNAKGLVTAASSTATGNLTDAGTDGITVTGGTGVVIGSGTSLSQHVADTTHNGYLASTDWNTFNGKQAAGSYITALTGDVTASGPGSAAATLATVNSNVGSFTNASVTVNAKGLVTAASSGTTPVTSVSGTTNQITSTGGTTPTLAIANPVTFPGAMTAGGALAMGANKITGLANGTASTDAAAYGQLHYTQSPVQGTETTGTTTSSTTFVNGGASASITPTSASSKIKITITALGLTSASGIDGIVGVSRAGTDLFTTSSSPCLIGTSAALAAPMTLTYIDSPATTSSITYQIRIAVRGAGSFMIGGQASTGSTTIIILEEVI